MPEDPKQALSTVKLQAAGEDTYVFSGETAELRTDRVSQHSCWVVKQVLAVGKTVGC